MNACSHHRRCGEAGYLLLEAVIATALVAVCAGAALAAVVAATHAMARATPAIALTATAQNVLTDLRAATAYDPIGLAALAGRSAAFDANEPGADGTPSRVHVGVTVTRSAADGTTLATVTVRDAQSRSVTVSATLIAEAPAPGATLPAGTPAPRPRPPGGAPANDGIQL